VSRRSRLVVLTLALCLLIAVPVSAQALVIPMSVAEMTELADTIVEVRVIGAGARWTHDSMTRERSGIVTDVRLRVIRVIKGDVRPDFTLTQPGGIVGDIGLSVSDMPEFSPGERCILFLDENGVIGGTQGKVSLDVAAIAYEAPPVGVAATSIGSVSPSLVNAGIGEVLTINGSGFGASRGSGGVYFSLGSSATGFPAIGAAVVSWSDTRIQCVVPRGADSRGVFVVTDSGVNIACSVKVGYSDSGMVWASGARSVTYRINENTSDMTGEGAAILRAFDQWNASGADFSLSYGGTCGTSIYPVTVIDGHNDIYFTTSASFPTGAVALNKYWFYPSDPTGKVESDIIFNDRDFDWSNGGVSGTLAVETVALHELGHTVGLDDQYFDTDEAMGTVITGAIARSLSTYDKAGAIHIWGAKPTTSRVDVIEVAGDSRFDTAVESSRLAFPSGAATVVIATGRNWPDALGGAALAGAVGGPILLSDTSALPDSVKIEIARLDASHAIILGGERALDAGVEADLLSAGLTFERVAGASRFDTADAIAAETIARVAHYDGMAFVATGRNFPDALAASPIAAAKGWPVFLADPDADPAVVANRLQFLGVTDVLILGGEGVVPAAFATAFDDALDTVQRLSGTSRYDTCVAVAQYGVDNAGLSFDGVAISVGTRFPDALAGGPMCAECGSVMLLTDSYLLAGPVADVLGENKSDIDTVHFLGGPAAVTPVVRGEVLRVLE